MPTSASSGVESFPCNNDIIDMFWPCLIEPKRTDFIKTDSFQKDSPDLVLLDKATNTN